MADLAIDDEDRGELDEAEVVIALVLPAGQETAEAVEPAVADLDHPAPWRVAVRVARRGQRLRRARLGRDVRGVATTDRRFPAGVVVVAAVERYVRLDCRGPRHQDRIEQLGEFLHVGAVGPGHQAGNRDAFRLGQEVAFGAGFGAVGGVGAGGVRLTRPPFLPNGAFTMHPSAASQLQSSPISASYSASRTAHACASFSVATHSLNRSWTVDFGPNSRGNAAHWLPVRANQISPSKIVRSSRRGRPGFLRTFSLFRIGSSLAQRVSSTRQIVGSSRSVGAASAAACGELMPRCYH